MQKGVRLYRKLLIICLTLFSTQVAAQATSGSTLNETGGGLYIGALPIAIVANPLLHEALQAAQLPASCIGENTKACMPDIHTVELASILQAGFGTEWGTHFGITAFGTGPIASVAICGTLETEEARVAMRHIGIGCTSANPAALVNKTAALFGINQQDTLACMAAIEQAGAGAIGFVTADSVSGHYRFLKFNGQTPDIANFMAGNYALFGDVHGGFLTGNEVTQIFGVAGAVPRSSSPPMHVIVGSSFISTECAAERGVRSTSSGLISDLAN